MNNSIFQNAFYQVQFDYEKLNVLTEDDHTKIVILITDILESFKLPRLLL